MKKIGILLFSDFDLMDFAGPFEVFLTINRLLKREGEKSFCDIKLIGLDKTTTTVKAYGEMVMHYQEDYTSIKKLDIGLIPGTIDVEKALSNPTLEKAVKHLSVNSALITSVCTGAFFLAQAGLLQDKEWTTHFEDIELLEKKFPLLKKGTHALWVDSGNVITSGGISAGIAMSIYLVKRFLGLEWAKKTARQIGYPIDLS